MLPAIVVSLAITLVPLPDLGPSEYAYGYLGGLYEDGSNSTPSDHLAAGLRRAALITPRDGKIVFLSVGFGETERIFDAFTAMTRADPRVDRQVVFVNGAREGADSQQWIAPMSTANFTRIRDTLLTPAGLTEAQVQVAWVQLMTNSPSRALPPQDSGRVSTQRRNRGRAARAESALSKSADRIFVEPCLRRLRDDILEPGAIRVRDSALESLGDHGPDHNDASRIFVGLPHRGRELRNRNRAVARMGTVLVGRRNDAAIRRTDVAAR